MTCTSCAQKIHNALQAIDGVKNVSVHFDTKSVDIVMSQHIDIKDLNEAVQAAGSYSLHMQHEMELASQDTKKGTYYPLILVVLYILLGVGMQQYMQGAFEWKSAMNFFMGGFFIAFSFFKFLDLKGFAESYYSYDIPTKIVPVYGYVYPFIELGLGVSYVTNSAPFWTNVTTLVVMSVSLVGVVQSVVQKRKIQCACLGTVFNLPMSTVTIVEDAGMILMAAAMLFA